MAPIIHVEAVTKQFYVQRNRPVTLKEAMVRLIRGRRDVAHVHYALDDVTFSVERGRALGIIGHNGAGKSTLLRLMCGLGRPTAGRIQQLGRVSGLLDLGSGFHPDMSGRENIMTGGLLSGLSRRQVLEIEDEIIAFAELEQFINQPVRTYSSGMYLRLAFATAMQFDPDALIVDEVLAVGDARFQQKCLKRLADFRAAGKTLVVASHVADQISALCDEVLVLEDGKTVMQGDPQDAIDCYADLMRRRTERRAAQLAGKTNSTDNAPDQGSRQGTQEASIIGVEFFNDRDEMVESVFSGNSLTIDLEYSAAPSITDMACVFGIYSESHVKCFETSIPSLRAAFGPLSEVGRLRCRLPELPLLPGRYFVNIGLYPLNWAYLYDYHWQMHPIYVASGSDVAFEVNGVVSLRPQWSVYDQVAL